MSRVSRISRSCFTVVQLFAAVSFACVNDSPALTDDPPAPAASVATPKPAPAAPKVVVRDDLFATLEKAGYDGAFVVLDPQTNVLTQVHAKRCDEGFCPASTFKIPNSLIGLEHKAVADTETVLPWDGVNREIKDWNRDHSMRSAFKVSTVWFYQEIARRVGTEVMAKSLVDMHYGNEKLGGTIDMFWLDGELRVSPNQQVDFLRRMREGSLPLSKKSVDAVLDIMIFEQDEHVTLRAKTGWANVKNAPTIGWWVGILETDGRPVYFATLLLKTDPVSEVFAPARRELGKQLLRELGYVLPKPPAAPAK